MSAENHVGHDTWHLISEPFRYWCRDCQTHFETTGTLYCECDSQRFDPDVDAGCRRCGRPINFAAGSNPDGYIHAFATFPGLPPDKNDIPVCGAVLTDAYDFAIWNRPPCPACAKHIAANQTNQPEGD